MSDAKDLMRAILQSGHSTLGESGKPDPAGAASLDSSEKPPRRRDPKTLLLSGILALLVLYTVYFAADILLPVCFAFILQLVLQPAMRGLGRLHLPRMLAALVVIIALFAMSVCSVSIRMTLYHNRTCREGEVGITAAKPLFLSRQRSSLAARRLSSTLIPFR